MDPIATLQVAATAVFPLRVSPFEAFFLADESASHPMMFFMQMELQGVLDRESFDRALEWASWRHPLLRAKLVKRGAYDGQWTLDADWTIACHWLSEEGPVLSHEALRFDLTRECGLRVWGRYQDGKTTITFQFHHACCDGIGAGMFIDDLLTAYDGLCGDGSRATKTRALEYAQLDQRRFVRSAELRTAMANAGRSVLLWWNRYLWRQATPLPAAREASERTAFSAPGFVVHSFGVDDTNRLREASRNRGVTLNTLMLRDFFRCLARWSTAETGKPPRRLAILVPVDLRERSDVRLPACNRLGYAFADWRLRHGETDDQLLAALEAQSTRALQRQQAMVLLQGLAVARRIGTMSWLTNPRTCLATAVFSNLGDRSRRFAAKLPRHEDRVMAGNVVVERVLGAPPLRPGTCAGMTVGIYSRQLTICFRADPLHFDSSDMRRMLAEYVQQLTQTAQDGCRA